MRLVSHSWESLECASQDRTHHLARAHQGPATRRGRASGTAAARAKSWAKSARPQKARMLKILRLIRNDAVVLDILKLADHFHFLICIRWRHRLYKLVWSTPKPLTCFPWRFAFSYSGEPNVLQMHYRIFRLWLIEPKKINDWSQKFYWIDGFYAIYKKTTPSPHTHTLFNRITANKSFQYYLFALLSFHRVTDTTHHLSPFVENILRKRMLQWYNSLSKTLQLAWRHNSSPLTLS